MRVDTAHLTSVPYPGLDPRAAELLEILSWIWYDDSGPGHIVYADYNLRDSDLSFCIKACEEGLTSGPPHNFVRETFSDYPPGHPILKATAELLRGLLEIPAAERFLPGSEFSGESLRGEA